jgi:hypothetical protein
MAHKNLVEPIASHIASAHSIQSLFQASLLAETEPETKLKGHKASCDLDEGG